MYPFSVFKSSIKEIKEAKRDGNDQSLTNASVMKLFGEEILPWSVLFLNMANNSLADKKYGNAKEVMVDIFGPNWKSEQNAESVENFLEGLQGFLVHILLRALEWYNGQYAQAAIDDMYKADTLKSILYLVTLNGKASEYYDDSQFLVINGYLDQADLDYSIKIHKGQKRQ